MVDTDSITPGDTTHAPSTTYGSSGSPTMVLSQAEYDRLR